MFFYVAMTAVTLVGALVMFLCERFEHHKAEAEKWNDRYASKSSDYSKLLLEHQGCGLKMVSEIEARHGAEEAQYLMAGALLEIALERREKRTKKRK